MRQVFPLFIFVLVVFSFGCSRKEKEPKITEYVNPFIGTADHGHTFPGAAVPFGAVQLSPDNPRDGWDWCSGYHYSDSIISSFSHTHLSGTGVGDLQDLRFLPVATRPEEGCRADEYVRSGYARFSHDNEQAEPGYYRVKFDNGIVTELSVTPRCGIHYYQYPAGSVHGMTIDLTTGRNFDRAVETALKKVSNRKLQGYRKSKGWANDQRVYFTVEFSQDVEVMAGKRELKPMADGQKIVADTCYAWVDFGDKTDKVLVKVGLSSANIDGAEANLKEELPHWSFDKVKKDAKQAWRKVLSTIRVEGASEERMRTFYTALYHACIAPCLFSDVNGNFKGPDGEVHSVQKHDQYTVFSCWDTYRATHPLFTLIQRKRVGDMVNSMLKHYEAYGLLPVWELDGNETNCMVGNHSIPVIVEAYLKGIGGFDAEEAYEAMKTTVMADRAGLPELRRYGYIPYELENESVSKTLEYAYDDWCVAQMAKALNKEDDYLYFLKESRNYAALFDKGTGFMRGKSADGEWKTPFSPLYANHRNDEYTEGNAWQYAWYVPHDVEGLVALYGGAEPFITKLDSLFSITEQVEGDFVSPDISGMIGQYAQGNEPSHHVIYMYNYVGQPQKTQYYANKIMTELYSDKPDGLCGNEDCGQMSAWYVFSAMGFYPVNPVECKYQLGVPMFKKAVIHVGPEKRFVITSNRENDSRITVKKVLLNGEELNRTWITHDEIMQGGTLEFVLADKAE